jgi:hypothetical protein
MGSRATEAWWSLWRQRLRGLEDTEQVCLLFTRRRLTDSILIRLGRTSLRGINTFYGFHYLYDKLSWFHSKPQAVVKEGIEARVSGCAVSWGCIRGTVRYPLVIDRGVHEGMKDGMTCSDISQIECNSLAICLI